MHAHWKTTADDLRRRADAVTSEVAARGAAASSPGVSARVAAKVLSGIIGHVARTWSVDVMQSACATLVRNAPTWDDRRPLLISLPLEDGCVPEPIKLIALVAHGILPLAGAENVRAALSFWATEDDPGVWTRLVES